MVINPYDKDALRAQFRAAQPFPHIVLENFLDEGFLREVVQSYPDFEAAWKQAQGSGDAFSAVNEKFKVQVSDSESFPPPVKTLHEAVSSQSFLDDLEHITAIPKLLADPSLRGGGMHLTGPRGRLDVHIDFNYNRNSKLHRRLNILIYLNENWPSAWGGAVELWDQQVKNCQVSLPPTFNRCVIFETSDISYHGVEPVTCPPNVARKSFAGYYYTQDPPPNWDGQMHSTVFKPRPHERLRNMVLGGVERVQRKVIRRYGQAQRLVDRLRGRDD